MQLNQNLAGLLPSATLAINEESAALERAGKTIYRWGLGQSPFPVPACVVEALKENAHQKDYLPVQGLPLLRSTIAGQQRSRYHTDTQMENVLIGPGSKELLYLLQLVYAGDLFLPSPSWVSYAPQAKISGRKVHWLSTRLEEGWRLTADVLEEALDNHTGAPPILLLNYPCNPTGTTLRAHELSALADIVRKHGVLVISDEIYGDLHHEGAHRSISEFYPEGTIVCSGISKWCGAGGWRLGLSIFPDSLQPLLDAMVSVASETFTSVSAPIQYAAVRAYEGGEEIDDYIFRSRQILTTLGKYLEHTFTSAGVSVCKPEGAFYLFPDCSQLSNLVEKRQLSDSASLCRRLLQDIGVAVLPGSVFGRPVNELTFRLSYVNFDGEKALEAAMNTDPSGVLDERFIKEYCPEVQAAAHLVCDWLVG